MQQDRKAALLLLLCVTLWSTSGVLIKESTLPAMAIVGGRGAIAAVVLAVYLRRPRFTWSVAQVGGALAAVVTVSLFVTATQLTSAANAILLQYTAPLWVAVFGFWYLREKPHRIDYVTMAIIGVGMLLFFADSLTGDNLLGNVLAAISGVTMAWMTLFMRKQKDGSPLETLLLGNIFAAIIGLPFLATASPTPTDWGILLFLGVFQLGLPFILYSYAIKRLEALEVVLLSTLEPILNPVWVFLINGETPSLLSIVGGAIVLSAAFVRALVVGAGGRRTEQERTDQERTVEPATQ